MRKKSKIKLAVVVFVVAMVLIHWSVPIDCLHDIVNKKVNPTINDEPQVVDTISGDKYAYSCLNTNEQLVYDQILDCILTQSSEVVLSTTNPDTISKCYDCVYADYGGLFWAAGYQYSTYTEGDEIKKISISPKYTYTEDERVKYQAMVDEVVGEYLDKIPSNSNDYQKSKILFEELIKNVDYVEDAENNQNILSVFLTRRTVCQGYANAMQYLCTQIDIPCTVITGTANGEPHAWNMLYLDGAYYLLDATWGNSAYSMPDSDDENRFVNYAYLNVTSEELSATHIVEMPIETPECTATEDNYFRQEGLYFDTWMPSEIGYILKETHWDGDTGVSFKFSDAELYQKTKEYFIEDFHIKDYIWSMQNITYLENENIYVITFRY